MQRSAARTSVRTRLGLSGAATDALLTDAVINEQLKFALDDIANEYDWPWLTTTATVNIVAGVASLPADFKRAKALESSGVAIMELSLRDVLESGTAVVAFTRAGWYIEGGQIKTYPSSITQSGLILHYVRDEDAMDGDTDVPLMPSRHDDLWIARTAMLCSQIRRDFDGAAFFRQEYEAGINRIRDDVARRTGPTTIKSRRNRRLVAGAWGS